VKLTERFRTALVSSKMLSSFESISVAPASKMSVETSEMNAKFSNSKM